MDASHIGLGDWVIYTDTDQIEWGPWRVIFYSQNQLVVAVEDTLTMLLFKHQVRKYNMELN